MTKRRQFEYGYDEDSMKNNGRKERKNKKRSSRHNAKIMIDKVNHGLIDSTDLDEYLEDEND